ncbi:hypothetical protein LOTGIDRAFT_129996, partial [Lottia gigantea]
INRRKKKYPKDVVILHGVGRGPYCPSLSPFVLKVETYFRMNRIPYQLEPGFEMSSKGKIPWIEYNGEIINDSSFIIQYFNKKLGIDLDRSLSPRERAIARAFQKMSEENLLWGLALCRWVYKYESYKWMGIPWLLCKMVGRTVRKNAFGHGIGRHTQQEVLHIMEADIQALSDFLGNKKFLMGDDPTEVDNSIFGILSQMMWHSVDQPGEMLIKGEKYPNLRDYCTRMKELFWKDWNDCITHGGTREATR